MNPIPLNLRHLEALFDHYSVDSRGHFLGESSSFYLCSKPALPLLPAVSTSAASHAASQVASHTASQPHHPQDTSSPVTLPAATGPTESHATTVTRSDPASSNQSTSSSFTVATVHDPANTAAVSWAPLPHASAFPGPRLGTGVLEIDAFPPPTGSGHHFTAINNSGSSIPGLYRDMEFPVVAQSTAILAQFPPRRLARELIVLYLTKANRFMPIIPTLFLEEYDAGVLQSPFLLLSIFAIASKYSSDPMCRSDMTRAQTAGETYCKTACRLVDEFLDCPRLSTVQGLFLLGKHLEESKNQRLATKAFMYVGMAIRMAMDMGLNRNISAWGLDPVQIEYRNRTWWYLYVYDRAQGSMYGRPYMIQDLDCAAEKPKPDPLAKQTAQDKVDVEHLLNLIHLSTLLGRVMDAFYPANTSGSNFYSSSRGLLGRVVSGETGAVDPAASSSSTAAGNRKRSKTASKLRSKDNGDIAGDVGSAGGAKSISASQAQTEMLTRQHLANQKQDAVVAELDKELTDWVQALPAHLQWDMLLTEQNVYGDILHSMYYVILILLHRPSIRLGEVMPTTITSRQDKCPFAPDPVLTMEGCHSMAVCAQAARRITTLAGRCQNLVHLERFGAGAFILLHAARVHLILAAIPAPTRGSGLNGCGPSADFLEAIRRKEQAVDQFHRCLGSLRKFSVYHWTVDGIGLSIRSLERTLAAILQEQEIDHEQEMLRQRQLLLDYDSEFITDRDRDLDAIHLTSTATSTTGAAAGAEGAGGTPKGDERLLDESTASSGPKTEEESLHERTYYESMRLLEMRLLYLERHRFSKDKNHLEQHLECQDGQSKRNPGMDLAPRRGLSDATTPAAPNRVAWQHSIADLFDKNASLTSRSDGATTLSSSAPLTTTTIPSLVIRTYKPNTTGKQKRRGGSNAAGSSTGRNKPGAAGTSKSNVETPSRPASTGTLDDAFGADEAEGIANPDPDTFASMQTVSGLETNHAVTSGAAVTVSSTSHGGNGGHSALGSAGEQSWTGQESDMPIAMASSERPSVTSNSSLLGTGGHPGTVWRTIPSEGDTSTNVSRQEQHHAHQYSSQTTGTMAATLTDTRMNSVSPSAQPSLSGFVNLSAAAGMLSEVGLDGHGIYGSESTPPGQYANGTNGTLGAGEQHHPGVFGADPLQQQLQQVQQEQVGQHQYQEHQRQSQQFQQQQQQQFLHRHQQQQEQYQQQTQLQQHQQRHQHQQQNQEQLQQLRSQQQVPGVMHQQEQSFDQEMTRTESPNGTAMRSHGHFVSTTPADAVIAVAASQTTKEMQAGGYGTDLGGGIDHSLVLYSGHPMNLQTFQSMRYPSSPASPRSMQQQQQQQQRGQQILLLQQQRLRQALLFQQQSLNHQHLPLSQPQSGTVETPPSSFQPQQADGDAPAVYYLQMSQVSDPPPMFPSQLHFVASGHQDGGGHDLLSTGFSLGQGATQSALDHQYQQGSQQQQHQQQHRQQQQKQQHVVQHSTGLGYHVTQAVGVRSPAGSTGSVMSSSSPATSNYSTANSATPPPMRLPPGISAGSSNGAGAGTGSVMTMTSTVGGMVMSRQMTVEGYDTGFGTNMSGEVGTDPNGTQLGSTGGVYWEQLGQE